MRKWYRVRYTDPGTGIEMLTGLTTFNDATIKAAALGGVVVEDSE